MDVCFGLKLWSTNSDLLNDAKELIEADVFQYIELTPIPGTEITPLLEYDLPYVIHITTERHGLNISDKEKRGFNLKTIDECIKWANELNARYLILHPGFGLIGNTLKFLKEINDNRILIENMPKVGLNNEAMVGYIPDQIRELMGDEFGFCLDFGHAIKASVSLNRNYMDLIDEFMGLNPTMFHLSDGHAENAIDEHLSLGDGNFDLNYLKECILRSESRRVTLETPRITDDFEEDKRNIAYIKRLLSGI